MRTGWQLIHLKALDLVNLQVSAASWMQFASWIVERSQWEQIREVTVHMGTISNHHADAGYKEAVEAVKHSIILRMANANWEHARRSATSIISAQ